MRKLTRFLLLMLAMLPQWMVAQAYDLTVAGVAVTSANAQVGITGDGIVGTVTFEAASAANGNVNTLTLDGATLKGGIVSGLDNLTIHLSESNEIQGEESTPLATGVKSTNANATLTFTSEVNTHSEPMGRLRFINVTTPFDGFCTVAFKSGLIYYE